MKILITAAVTAQAYKLKGQLDSEATFIFANQGEVPVLPGREHLFLSIPSAGSTSFAHEMLTLCLDHQIDYVYPLRRAEILALAEAKQLFEEYNIKVVVPAKLDNLRFKSSVPSNGKILVVCQEENQLAEQGTEGDLGTGVYVATPDGDEINYYIYSAD